MQAHPRMLRLALVADYADGQVSQRLEVLS